MTETRPISGGGDGDGDDRMGEAPPKTIGNLGSLSLVANNISGPAMMGLPLIFRQAGIIPTVATILLVWVLSSFCGTFLSETIQQLPGNRKFDKNADFSFAFAKVVGQKWHAFVETLVIMSCAVNALAGIVETAQALDSFLASFVFGSTYAVTVPGMELVQWDSALCQGAGADGGESKTSQCTPFHYVDSNIISLGYVVTFLALYPLGRNDLKETMAAQIASFIIFFLLCFQFLSEFHNQGEMYLSEVPMFGSNMSQLAGVVLFNYAFPITIPSWLNEKRPEVSVNKIIWSSSAIATTMYILFGILAAGAFNKPGSDILVVLASNKVSKATQFCAALFGGTIIGLGVPVFCVIVKNQLYQTGLFTTDWSRFWGSLFPYLIGWWMYQGKALMAMVNWAGLIVNGTVAFILPLLLALIAYRTDFNKLARAESKSELEMQQVKGKYTYSSIADEESECADNRLGEASSQGGDATDSDLVTPLPEWMEPARGSLLTFGTLAFIGIIVSTLFIDIITGTAPSR